jgi:hypothetical protein
MSSPHVAGLFALLKQAHPTWTAATAKSALMTTAHQDVLDNDRVEAADPFDMGAGHVKPGRFTAKGSAFQPGLAFNATRNDYLAWMCGASPANISAATCATLAGLGFSLDPSDLNLASVAVAQLTGSQTVKRRVTNVSDSARTYTASSDAPAGYTVSVSPSTFTIAPGATVALDVTITSVSADVAQWKFGSYTLTEKTGKYKVRSPIAVKASALDFPAEVQGAGETGSTEFQVKFGYSGDYDAKPHGLVPATVTHDTVIQDTEPSGSPVFTPSDVGNGANVHEFTLTGAAHFRVALPAASTEAGADLDVYVYDPSDTRVGQSTGGSGANEIVNISNPANGTWKVYVHGWATPGGSSDYDLFTWAIPAAPDTGNLTIASEPDDATVNTFATIEPAWTGATTGQWWLGMVSHWRNTNELGRTFVNVDNR